MNIGLVLLACALNAAVGYVIGKYGERMKWSRLIHLGILPKPQKDRYNG